MRSDDWVPILTAAANKTETVGMRQATCLAIDRNAGTNTILVGGVEMHDLPILNPAATILLPGDIVALLRYHHSYLIIGKLWSPGQGTYAYWSAGSMTPGSSQWDSWPSTTSGSYQEILRSATSRLSSALSYDFSTYVGPNTSGQFQLTANGVEIANSGTFTGGTAGAIGFWINFADWPSAVDVGAGADIALNARVTAGTGKAAAVCRALLHVL